jgi:hypothetical protein
VSNPEDFAQAMGHVVHTPDHLTGAAMALGMMAAKVWKKLRDRWVR